MSLRVSFELDDNDLKHFQLIMREARKAAARMAPEDIVAAAEQLLWEIGDDQARWRVVVGMASSVQPPGSSPGSSALHSRLLHRQVGFSTARA